MFTGDPLIEDNDHWDDFDDTSHCLSFHLLLISALRRSNSSASLTSLFSARCLETRWLLLKSSGSSPPPPQPPSSFSSSVAGVLLWRRAGSLGPGGVCSRGPAGKDHDHEDDYDDYDHENQRL